MLDDNFYAQLGQDLSEEQKQAVARRIYSQLEDEVGEQLATQISDDKFEHFQDMLSTADEAELDGWLEINAPGYEKLVDDTLEQIKQEAIADPQEFLN